MTPLQRKNSLADVLTDVSEILDLRAAMRVEASTGSSLLEVFSEIATSLPQEDFVFAGGLVANLYQEPRGTKDIDLVVLGKTEVLKNKLQELGYALKETFDFSVCHILTFVREKSVPVDLIEIKSPRLKEILASQVRDSALLEETVPVLSAEAIVLMKLLSFRTKDKADIESIDSEVDLDMGLLKEWATDLKIFNRLSILKA